MWNNNYRRNKNKTQIYKSSVGYNNIKVSKKQMSTNGESKLCKNEEIKCKT